MTKEDKQGLAIGVVAAAAVTAYLLPWILERQGVAALDAFGEKFLYGAAWIAAAVAVFSVWRWAAHRNGSAQRKAPLGLLLVVWFIVGAAILGIVIYP